jgi:hypothetical protein
MALGRTLKCGIFGTARRNSAGRRDVGPPREQKASGNRVGLVDLAWRVFCLPGRSGSRVRGSCSLHRAGTGNWAERRCAVRSVVSPRGDQERRMPASRCDRVTTGDWRGQLPHRSTRGDRVRARGRQARMAVGRNHTVRTCSAVPVRTSANCYKPELQREYVTRCRQSAASHRSSNLRPPLCSGSSSRPRCNSAQERPSGLRALEEYSSRWQRGTRPTLTSTSLWRRRIAGLVLRGRPCIATVSRACRGMQPRRQTKLQKGIRVWRALPADSHSTTGPRDAGPERLQRKRP